MIIALTLAASFAAIAHEGHHHGEAYCPASNYQHGVNNQICDHDEGDGDELPDDPVYADANGDGVVSADEMVAENIRWPLDENDQTILAKNPLLKEFNINRFELALTIDDGPNPTITPKILDLLDQYNIKATFFVVGSLAERYPSIIQDIERRGHTIGNHTYSHDVPHITGDTLVSEITKAFYATKKALGHAPKGRLLFRAPGLAWNQLKEINGNADPFVRRFIGPAHANLGTDAPRADWACWSHKPVPVSAETCATWYFEDITKKGTGVILTHDVFYRPGAPNTLELLKILLARLDSPNGGGIKNAHGGQGLWTFKRLEDSPLLAPYDVDGVQTPVPAVDPVPVKPAPVAVPGRITSFKNNGANVRTAALEKATTYDSSTLIFLSNGTNLKAGQLLEVTDLGQTIKVAGTLYKKVKIEKTQAGLEQYTGQVVYIWADAF
jgi:peptidoglycan/xylan/chitin deacetylase (PgdA/CDA1 family)